MCEGSQDKLDRTELQFPDKVKDFIQTCKEILGPRLEEDESLPARAVKYRLEIIEQCKLAVQSSDPEVSEWAKKEMKEALRELWPDFERQESGFVWDYWTYRWNRMWQNEKLRKSLPALTQVFNAAFLLILLRVSVPRLLAMQSMGDLGEFAKEFGLPSREELQEYLKYLDGLDFATKFALFTLVFAVEKVFLIGEFIPFGVILPTISPILFGGVAAGAAITATSSTLASSVNFFLGRRFLTNQVREFQLPGQGPIGDSSWFKAITRRFDSSNFNSTLPEGFKSVLILRLAPLLPIPVDAHWYVAGTTPVRFWEFFAAHFIGTMKVAILDAYLGSLLLQAATESSRLEEQTRGAVIIETVALVAISAFVTTYATNIFTTILAEEGYKKEDLM